MPRAQRTLTFIVAVLGLLLAGVAFLCRVYGVGAMDQEQPGYQSVVSQRVAAVVGRGFIYYVSIASVLAVLCLSANTSGLGAVVTAAALVVILVAKFTEGAWVTLLLIPAALFVFYRIKGHYPGVSRQIHKARAFVPGPSGEPLVIVPIEGWNRLTEEALRFGTRISADVVAVHVTLHEDINKVEAGDPRPDWEREVEAPARLAGMPPPRLEVIESPHRQLFEPLVDFIKARREALPEHRLVAVITPELFQMHWVESLLHNDRAQGLREALLALRDHHIVVVTMPWYLEEREPEPALLGCGEQPPVRE